MQVTVRVKGPAAPPGGVWCAVCVMIAKQAVIAANNEVFAAAQLGNGDAAPRVTMDTQQVVLLEPAVTRAISWVVPQWGPLEVCWTHALGLEILPGGVAPASPAEAAMVNQAVMLNRKGKR